MGVSEASVHVSMSVYLYAHIGLRVGETVFQNVEYSSDEHRKEDREGREGQKA